MTEEEKATQFWNWFQENNQKFHFINKVNSRDLKNQLLDEFLEQLHKYCKGLFFEIGGHPDHNEVELIISAEGVIDYFDNVEELVRSAPEIKDWKIIAFKPPLGRGFKTTYNEKEFNPSKIIFIPLSSESNPDNIGLRVFYPDYTEEERSTYLMGTYLALDTLIGEKSTALDIDYLDVARTPDNIVDFDIRHLEDIQEYIKEKKDRF